MREICPNHPAERPTLYFADKTKDARHEISLPISVAEYMHTRDHFCTSWSYFLQNFCESNTSFRTVPGCSVNETTLERHEYYNNHHGPDDDDPEEDEEDLYPHDCWHPSTGGGL